MKYKILTMICLLALTLSACKTKGNDETAYKVTPTITPAITANPSATITPVSTPTAEPTITPSPTTTPTPKPTPEPKHSKLYSKYKKLFGQEFDSEDGRKYYVKVTDGKTLYSQNTVAFFDDSELMCDIEKIRTVDPLSNKRYIMVDFSVMNLSDSNFDSNEYYLSLSDKSGYTYSPVIYTDDELSAPVGNINMILKPEDMARGEVVFKVPYKSSPTMELRYDIPNDKVGRAKFSIDLSTSVNQNGVKSSSVR